jgi:hypothetical protein
LPKRRRISASHPLGDSWCRTDFRSLLVDWNDDVCESCVAFTGKAIAANSPAAEN